MSDGCPTCRTFAEENHKQHLELAGYQAEILHLVREKNALKRELTNVRRSDPASQDITAILKLWRVICVPARGRSRVSIDLDGPRAALTRKALKTMVASDPDASPEEQRRQRRRRCMNAVRGLALRPYVGPQGRTANPVRGTTRRHDIRYALMDEQHIEEHAEFYRFAQAKPLEWKQRAADAAFEVAGHYLLLYQDARYSDRLRRQRELLSANPLELGAVATRTGFTVGQIQAAVAGDAVPSTERPALFVVPDPESEAA